MKWGECVRGHRIWCGKWPRMYRNGDSDDHFQIIYCATAHRLCPPPPKKIATQQTLDIHIHNLVYLFRYLHENRFVCIYVYIYIIYIYIYIYVYRLYNIYICVCVCINMYMNVYIRTTQTYIYIYIPAYPYIYITMYPYMYVYICIHTYITHAFATCL